MENVLLEATPWPDVLLDICSLGETDEAFNFDCSSFRRPFTEVGKVTLRVLAAHVNVALNSASQRIKKVPSVILWTGGRLKIGMILTVA